VAEAISRQAFSDLIGSIYDCALDPSRWEQTLADVGDALDCHGTALILTDLRYDRLLLLKTVGIEPDQIERFLKLYPRASRCDKRGACVLSVVGRATCGIAPLLPCLYRDVSVFQEWERATGTVDSMRLFLMHAPRYDAGIGVGRNEPVFRPA
jgi:hypothetical protein